MGDLFFALANLARRLGIDPESALQGANAKFARRFRDMESMAEEKNIRMEAMPLCDLEELWRMAKKKESNNN
jgi:ATP diphosphatase